MTTSRDELHRLIDALPDEQRDEAEARLRELLEETGQGAREGEMPARDNGAWSGEGLLSLAGSVSGPSDLSRRHDAYTDPGA